MESAKLEELGEIHSVPHLITQDFRAVSDRKLPDEDRTDRLVHHFRYRPEVDGLRAVAVLAVLFFHAGIGAPGGYVGVDVFFVISGFLITSLIVRDLQDDSFSLVHFWERRARRILPALALVIIATLAAGYFLLLPGAYQAVGRSAAYQAVFAGNFHFWQSSGYFAGFAEEMPLLHTWSLAVEEQFYLALPLLLLGLFRFRALRRRSAVLGVLGVTLLLSFLVSVHAVPRYPSGAFYLLPSRAWELMAGSMLALLPLGWYSSRRWAREAATFLGMGLIGLSIMVLNEHTAFPGWAALPPCMGTLLIIWGNSPVAAPGEVTRLTSLGRLLASRPVVFVGLISYSLYLWHWPLIAFSNYLAVDTGAAAFRIGLIVTSFTLAILSWRFVETPFRRERVFAGRRRIFAFSGSALACFAILGIAVVVGGGLPQRLPQEAQGYQAARGDRGDPDYRTLAEVQRGELGRFGKEGVRPSILLWGDSHSQVMLPALDLFARDLGRKGVAVSFPQTAPVLGRFSGEMGMREHSEEWAGAVIRHVRKHQIEHTFLAARWEMYLWGDIEHWELGDGRSNGRLEAAFLATVRALNEAGSKVWLINQVPSHPMPVPRALAFSTLRGTNPVVFQTPPATHQRRLAAVQRLKEASAHLDLEILDPAPLFLDAESGRYRTVINGRPLYYDGNHLCKTAVETLIYPWLRESVLALAGDF